MGFSRAGALLGVSSRAPDDRYRKAVMSASAPTIIQEQEADRLIDLIVDESKLWQMATVERMETNQKVVRYIDLTQGIIRPRECGTATDSGSITASACHLSTVDLVVSFPICDDTLNKNIEGAALEAHILGMTAKVMANELELLALMANTDGSYSTSFLNAATISLFDGWYKQLQAGHVIDAGNATDTSGRALHICKLSDLRKQLPTKWKRDPSKLKIFMPTNMGDDFDVIIGGRQTPMGDRMLTGDIPRQWGKSMIEEIPLLPTDLTNCSSGSFAPANGTFMFMTDPKNLVLGILLSMEYERWREGNAHRTWHIWRISFDAKICVPDATALYDCMTIGPCSDLYCQAQTCS